MLYTGPPRMVNEIWQYILLRYDLLNRILISYHFTRSREHFHVDIAY